MNISFVTQKKLTVTFFNFNKTLFYKTTFHMHFRLIITLKQYIYFRKINAINTLTSNKVEINSDQYSFFGIKYISQYCYTKRS